MTTPDTSTITLDQIRHAHFLGIGGVGVSGLARILVQQGKQVTGTDAKDLPVMHELQELGAHTYVGYSHENIQRAEKDTATPIDVVIASSVATRENPERQAAETAKIPVLHRSEGLALLMQGRRVFTIAGTHGKTTTSSMAAMAFTSAGVAPSFAVGAAVGGLGVNSAHGAGEWFIAEADESDGTLLNYRPDIAVVTNIEADHLDFYGTEEAVHQVFFDHAQHIVDGGSLIVCADDPGAAALADRVQEVGDSRIKVLRYGTAGVAGHELDLAITVSQSDTTGTGQEVTYRWANGATNTVHLALPGSHNALNAAAVLLAAAEAGLTPEQTALGLGHYTGSARRFEFHGEAKSVRVFDDYAHHPTEVAAALTAARALAAGARVHVVFQPHLFSRTQTFAQEFAQALSMADTVRVLDIYAAREEPIEGVTAELISSQLAPEVSAKDAAAQSPATVDEALKSVTLTSAPGDIILTLGAGDINQMAPKIVERLAEKAAKTQ